MEIEDFVSGQKAIGAPQGEGEFSISLEGMSSRYATFQNDNEAYYLLRLIQSLVRLGAAEVHVKSTRRTIQVDVPKFSSKPDWLAPDLLLELLQQPHRWDRPFEGVGVAFLCVHDGVFQDLQWGHGNRRLTCSSQTGTYEIADAPELSGELYFKIKKDFRLLSSSTAAEHAECLSRIASIKTAITFDGRLLTASSPSIHMQKQKRAEHKKQMQSSKGKVDLANLAEGKATWFREYSRDYLLLEAETAEPPDKGWDALGGHCGKWKSPDAWAPLKTFLPKDHVPYVHLALSPRLEGESHLWPILDGVIATRPIKRSRFPALEGYVDALNYETDLSGLVVLEGDSLVESAGRFYRSLLLNLREFVHLLEASWDLSYPEYPLSFVTGAISGMALMGGIPHPLVALPPALVIDLTVSRVRFERNRKTFSEKFRKEILQRIDRLLQDYPDVHPENENV